MPLVDQSHATLNVSGPNGNNAFEYANDDIPKAFVLAMSMLMEGDPSVDFDVSEVFTLEICSALNKALETAGFSKEQIGRVNSIIENEGKASAILTSKFLKESRVISLPDRYTNHFRSAWTAKNPWAGPFELIHQLVSASKDGKLVDLKKSKYKVIPVEWEGGHEVQILYLLLFDLICARMVDFVEEKAPGTKQALLDLQKSLCADMDKAVVSAFSSLIQEDVVVHAQEVRGTQLASMEEVVPGCTVVTAKGIDREYVQHTAIILPVGWRIILNISEDVYKRVIHYAKEYGEGVPDEQRITAALVKNPADQEFLLVSAHAGSGGESALAMMCAAEDVYTSRFPDAIFVMGMDTNAEVGGKVKGLHRNTFDDLAKANNLFVTPQMPTMKRARLPSQAQPLKRSVVALGASLTEDGIEGDLEYTVEEHPKDVILLANVGKDVTDVHATSFNRIADEDRLAYLEDVMCPNKNWAFDHFGMRTDFLA